MLLIGVDRRIFALVEIKFSKYQGTGNDFVMLDNVSGGYNDLTLDQIRFLCDRKLGVGADGLIKISSHDEFDFEVEYFNADGSQSFCGNGARCSVAFANSLGLIKGDDGLTTFGAIDGRHIGYVLASNSVKIDMLPVTEILKVGDDYVVDTGSPHYIRKVSQPADIVELGRLIRYSDRYKEVGINVNTIESISNQMIRVQTYERGVEDETLSCGTGVTACALVVMDDDENIDEVTVETKGGLLSVSAEREGQGFKNIWLTGPIKHVFDGIIYV